MQCFMLDEGPVRTPFERRCGAFVPAAPSMHGAATADFIGIYKTSGSEIECQQLRLDLTLTVLSNPDF